MTDATTKDRPMTQPDARSDVVKDVPKSTAKMEFSLTSGAKRVGLSRNVLRDACTNDELPHRMNTKGHYVIEHDQLMKWKKSRDEMIEKDRLKTVFTPESNVRQDVRSDVEEGASERASSGAIETVRGPSVDEGDISVKNLLLEHEVQSLKTRLQETKSAFDDYKSFAEKSMQALITDQRETSRIAPEDAHFHPEIIAKSAGQGSHFWQRLAAVFVVVALVGSALYYRENIANQWANFTASDNSTAATTEPKKPQG